MKDDVNSPEKYEQYKNVSELGDSVHFIYCISLQQTRPVDEKECISEGYLKQHLLKQILSQNMR